MRLSGNIGKLLFHAALGVALLSIPLAFGVYAQKVTDGGAPKNPLLGRWKSTEAVIEFRSDGSIKINDDEYKYKVKGTVITVSNNEGALLFPFELDGDKLTVEFQGREVVYTRLKGKDAESSTTDTGRAEGIIPEFVGKWCYMSNPTGSNSMMSSQCFVLTQNGTYTYSAESSSSGAYGSTASQSSDSGRWTATRTTLTAYSNKKGKIVYPIQLRNHPKTGDPMIVLDGAAFVTFYNKRPW